jgi:hypothetical protein
MYELKVQDLKGLQNHLYLHLFHLQILLYFLL